MTSYCSVWVRWQMASCCSVWVSWQTTFYCSVWVRWRLGSDQQLWRQPMDASMPVNFAIPVFEQRHALDEWNNIQCSSVIVHQSSMHLNGFLIHVKWRALYRACHRRKTCYPSESARYMYMYVYIPTYKTNMCGDRAGTGPRVDHATPFIQ